MNSNSKGSEVLDDFPTDPSLLQACSTVPTGRGTEWACSRCGNKWRTWPGNNYLCAVLTDGRRVDGAEEQV